MISASVQIVATQKVPYEFTPTIKVEDTDQWLNEPTSLLSVSGKLEEPEGKEIALVGG